MKGPWISASYGAFVQLHMFKNSINEGNNRTDIAFSVFITPLLSYDSRAACEWSVENVILFFSFLFLKDRLI